MSKLLVVSGIGGMGLRRSHELQSSDGQHARNNCLALRSKTAVDIPAKRECLHESFGAVCRHELNDMSLTSSGVTMVNNSIHGAAIQHVWVKMLVTNNVSLSTP